MCACSCQVKPGLSMLNLDAFSVYVCTCVKVFRGRLWLRRCLRVAPGVSPRSSVICINVSKNLQQVCFRQPPTWMMKQWPGQKQCSALVQLPVKPLRHCQCVRPSTPKQCRSSAVLLHACSASGERFMHHRALTVTSGSDSVVHSRVRRCTRVPHSSGPPSGSYTSQSYSGSDRGVTSELLTLTRITVYSRSVLLCSS